MWVSGSIEKKLVQTSLILLFLGPINAGAAQSTPIVIGCQACESVSDFQNRIHQHMLSRIPGDMYDSTYVVISEADAKIAIAETTFMLLDIPPYYSYYPYVSMVTQTVEETVLADQFLLGRAAYHEPHVDELPRVDFPNNDVVVGSGDYQTTVDLFVARHLHTLYNQYGEEIAFTPWIERGFSFYRRLGAAIADEAFNVFFRIDFQDGSYAVYVIKDKTTAGRQPVYFIDKHGEVIMIDESVFDDSDIEDPNISEPDITGSIDSIPHDSSASFGARGYVAGTGGYLNDIVVVYTNFPTGDVIVGRVYVEEVPDQEQE
jgi:hypothetical protein